MGTASNLCILLTTLSFGVVAKFAVWELHRENQTTKGDDSTNFFYFNNHIDAKSGERNAIFFEAWLDNLFVEVHLNAGLKKQNKTSSQNKHCFCLF